MLCFFLLLFLLNLFTCNLVFWWSVFLAITILFIFINKSNGSISAILNYFVIQEFLGLVFLLLNFYLVQFVILIIKVGIAPFHFWVFSVVNSLSGFSMI